jgi:16S rRNA (guanine527-N7)-methyltransferase
VFHVKQSHTPTPAAPLDVSRETQERLEAYATLLTRWNARINLVAPRDLPHLWERHIADSLQITPLIPPGVTRAIDLGSGGGFPGLMLAIATGVSFDLVESDQRKAAFLREAARITAAPARIHAARIETLTLEPAPLITARALAPLPQLLDLAAPLLAPGGMCLFLKGVHAGSELTAATAEWHMEAKAIPSRTGEGGCILQIRDIVRGGTRG